MAGWQWLSGEAAQGPQILPFISVLQMGSHGHFSYTQGSVLSHWCWVCMLLISRNTLRYCFW